MKVQIIAPQRQDKGQRAFIAPSNPAFHGRIQEKADGAGAQRIVLGNDGFPFRHRQGRSY